MNRMTAKEFQDIGRAEKNKFGAKRMVVDGIGFDSKREAKRWCELRILEQSGQIKDLKRQVIIELQGRDGPLLTRTGRKMKITVDFTYIDLRDAPEIGVFRAEDSKGAITRDYEVRKAVLAAQGVELIEV